MAHTALYGGTVYEKKGGADLVGGTVYKKDHGKVLVGGTAYEVGFGHPVTVAGGYNVIGAGYTATIDDVSYPFTSAWSLETVSTASVTVTSLQATGRIAVNGEVVLTGAGDYTVDLSGATHILLNSNMLVMMITTFNIESPKDVTITVTGAGYSGLAQIEHNGIVYTGATKFTAKTGDLIHVKAKLTTGNVDYYYLVNSDALFTMNHSTSSSGATGSVGITTIPEGHILLTVSGTPDASYAYYKLDGVQRTNTGMFAIAPDSVLTVHVDENIALASHLGKRKATITLNGTTVVENDMGGNYTIPLGDAPEVKLNFTTNTYTGNGETSYWGVCNITAVPEGHALVSIKGTGNSSDYYVSIDGTKYISATAVTVPIGTTIYCYVQFEEKDSDYYGLIYLNGTKVASTTNPTARDEYYAEYNYTVNGNTTITLSSYVISIREQ